MSGRVQHNVVECIIMPLPRRSPIYWLIYFKRSKSAKKQTWCTTYRLDLLFCLMLLDVYFVTSKLGLLNLNYFSLKNFILLNANLKLLNINPHATEHKLKIVEYMNFLLKVKVICWIKKLFDKHMKVIYWKWKSFVKHIKIICWTSIIHFFSI